MAAIAIASDVQGMPCFIETNALKQGWTVRRDLQHLPSCISGHNIDILALGEHGEHLPIRQRIVAGPACGGVRPARSEKPEADRRIGARIIQPR
jgi:hypothetical protein